MDRDVCSVSRNKAADHDLGLWDSHDHNVQWSAWLVPLIGILALVLSVIGDGSICVHEQLCLACVHPAIVMDLSLIHI